MDKKMYIIIKKDAPEIYEKEKMLKAGNSCILNPSFSESWLGKLKNISGKTIEVDTEFLFPDQFNTVPIEGVSEKGLRIMSNLVEKVVNDQRIGLSKCQWCGAKNPSSVIVCMKCGRSEHIEPLFPCT